MASYPTSVFGPAARSNGQTIDASHVDDLQDEVTAIAGALLGTITHSVNVSGASTLATLQCAGSTFSVRPVTPPPDAAMVELASTMTIGSSALSTLSFLTQAYLTNSSIHSTAANPERLVPQSTGLYRFTAQVHITANSSGSRSLELLDSTGTSFAAVSRSSEANPINLQVTGYKRFDVLGGYVTCRLNVTGTLSTLSLGAQGAGGVSWFAMEKL